MANEKGSFVVYTDIKEIIDDLDDKQVADLFRAMLDYQVTGKAPKLTGSLKYIFIPIRQQMDRDREKWDKTRASRSESGRKGGLKSAESRAKQNEANQANASFRNNTDWFTDKIITEANGSNASSGEANEANQAVTVTGTVTVNGDVTGTVSDSLPDAGLLSFDLIQYLNEKTGSDYKADKTNAVRIQTLLDSGYSPAELRSVIDKKCAEWMTDPKMRPYLRPSTIWGAKFPEYVSAPISIGQERERDEAKKRETLEAELTEKKETLSTLRASLDEIKPGTRLDERRALKEQIALLEDSIKIIEGRLK